MVKVILHIIQLRWYHHLPSRNETSIMICEVKVYCDIRKWGGMCCHSVRSILWYFNTVITRQLLKEFAPAKSPATFYKLLQRVAIRVPQIAGFQKKLSKMLAPHHFYWQERWWNPCPTPPAPMSYMQLNSTKRYFRMLKIITYGKNILLSLP